MGYVKHDVVIATVLGMDMPDADEFDEFLKSLPPELRGLVIGPVSSIVPNGYATYAFLPDGSEEGWPQSDIADQARERFKSLFRGSRWVHVVYGGDVELGHHASIIEATPVEDGRTGPHLASRPRAEWHRQRIVADLVLRLASSSMPIANAISEAFEAGREYEAGIVPELPSTGLTLHERGGVIGLAGGPGSVR